MAFVGYGELQGVKGWKMFDWETQKVHVSCDVVFPKKIFSSNFPRFHLHLLSFRYLANTPTTRLAPPPPPTVLTLTLRTLPPNRTPHWKRSFTLRLSKYPVLVLAQSLLNQVKLQFWNLLPSLQQMLISGTSCHRDCGQLHSSSPPEHLDWPLKDLTMQDADHCNASATVLRPPLLLEGS